MTLRPLGVRQRSRGSALIAISMLGSAMLATVGLLGVAAAGRVRDGEDLRVSARSYTFTESEDPAVYLRSNPINVDGQQTTIVSLAVVDDRALPVPPGLGRLPRPGEVFWSAALERSCREQPTDCPVQGTVAGRIGWEGLSNPSERFAYVGVDRSALPLGGDAVGSFGVAARGRGAQFKVGDMGFSLFVLLPLAGLVAIAARSGARKSARRVLTLRVLGASPLEASSDQVFRLTLHASVGALLGTGAYVAATRQVSHLWGVGRAVESRDLRLGWLTLALVAVIVVGFVGIVAGLVAAKQARSAATPIRAARQYRGHLMTLSLVGGVAVLISQTAVSIGRPNGLQMTPLLKIGLVLFGVGMTSGLAPVVRAAGRMTARVGGPAGLVAGDRLRDDPIPPTRASAPIAIACFLVCLAVTVATIYAPLVSNGSFLPAGQTTVIFATRDAPQLLTTTDDLPKSVTSVLPETGLYDLTGAEVGRALIGDCATLRSVLDTPGTDCTDGAPQILDFTHANAASPDNVTLLDARGRTTEEIAPAGLRRVVIRDPPQSVPWFDLTVLVPPTWANGAATSSVVVRLIGRVPAERRALAELKSAVLRSDPTADVEGPTPGGDSLSGLFKWLQLGVVISTALNAVAMTIAFLDIADQQRRHRALLHVLGAGNTTIRRVHLTYVALPALINLAVALPVGVVAALGYAGSTRFMPSADRFLLIAAGGIATCLTAAALSALHRNEPAATARTLRAE